ncbi:hypothetical protein [Companilactobacillus ginsenosidimutans]|uniref:Lipoprotein n=1 Tax=Companilactobacillus ginsenosidimutans TaxID=1007676 RepID=A0A0H4QIC9_9LACO|nr:hypothetical protein [Companilactobacillus ginsenosidimutans]AKP66796.1 hypothetical protein ABM34_03920 [Companilactobacillus ginsenosidimutans]
MNKKIVTLLAAVTIMGTAAVTTACSNNTKTEQTETHSASKITKDEIVGKYYVGVSKNNKDQYLSFFTGKDGKDVTHVRVSKDGSKKTITYFMKKPKLEINKKDAKKFKIDGYSVISEPDFNYKDPFKKVGKTTIQSPDNKKWKLYNGNQSKVVNHVKKSATK